MREGADGERSDDENDGGDGGDQVNDQTVSL
jgi:hypothetical protein